MSTALETRVTPAEYLAMERASELKHELREGEIVSMPREFKSLDDTVRIETLDCALPLRDLYDKVWPE